MSQSEAKRFCPVCGEASSAAFCPTDRTPTVVAMGFSKHPRAYEVDDIVAGRYRITGALGAGGFAAVYAAEHMGTAQQVAVKLMAFDMTSSDSDVAVRRFFREARITASLSHPNTVRVFDVGQDDEGPLFIAMEMLVGESMEGLLKRRFGEGRGLSQAETLDISIQVLASLAEAHETGLVHRDLKPANIFLIEGADGSTTVKVLDFGIARTADSSLTLGGNMPGTPPFMSPEQCRGETVDGRSDLYSLAVLMFLCVCEALPFADSNVLKLMRMHSFEQPPDPRHVSKTPVSDELATVLLRTLAKRPADRPESAAELKRQLELIRDDSFGLGGMTIIPVAAKPVAGSATVDLLDMPTRDSAMIPMPRIDPNTVDIDFGDEEPEDSPNPTLAGPAPHEIKGRAPLPVDEHDDVSADRPMSAVEVEALAAQAADRAGAVVSVVAAPDASDSASHVAPVAVRPDSVASPVANVDARRGAPLLWVVLALLLVGGVASGVWLARSEPNKAGSAGAPVTNAVTPQQPAPLQSGAVVAAASANKKVAAQLAAKARAATSFKDKLDFARQAVELDPSNGTYRALLKSIEDDMANALAGAAAPGAPALPSAASAAPSPPPPADERAAKPKAHH